jgi:ABC-type transport system involved in cytochrome c biogenesis permease subunit
MMLLGWFALPLSASPEQEFPVLYKGRFRSAEAYARLWLYDIYHAPTLKSTDLTAFQTSTSSALSFLWSLDRVGYRAYQTAPLFWIGSAETKRLAHLPLTRDRFSYQELTHALYQDSTSSSSLVYRLATYLFLEASSKNPALKQKTRLELASFLPGLWIQWRGDDLIIASVPASSPWSFLQVGQLIASQVRSQAQEILKRDKKVVEDCLTLIANLKEFERLQGPLSSLEQAFRTRLTALQKQGLPSKEIDTLLEHEYPLSQRLRSAGSLFNSLPGRYPEGEWYPLTALHTQIYHPESNQLRLVQNFTLFSTDHFETIRHAYFDWEAAVRNEAERAEQQQLHVRLVEALEQAYRPLAGHIYQAAHGKQLRYPTFSQLEMEALYVSYPWIPLLIILYGIGACLLIFSFRPRWPFGYLLALYTISVALLFHTGLLAMRSYILGRPPVSNMFETVLYVPWVAACFSLIVPAFRRHPLVLLATCLTAIGLLLILEVTNLNASLDQVQAVLDSQFWLMIHVLLVVGSYGIFILGALLGHFYLGLYLYHRRETHKMHQLAQLILQTLYGGTLLLVIGTILGGIWAAESWGRFWDWDPKESWAFISSCFYLIWIHAYRFHRIGSFGLAIGAVSGLLVISFTWYGVNYILGTGLHSYGFGSGGEVYYYAFLGAECLFLALVLTFYVRQRMSLSEKL